jgi:hypothetical protein
MKPGTFDLDLYRGDSYTWRFVLWADDAKTQPVDLAGATVAAEARDKPGGLNIVAFDCVVTPPNIIDVDLTAAMWAGVTVGTKAWDLEVTMADGEVRTVVAGKVTVTGDVTNSTALIRRTK